MRFLRIAALLAALCAGAPVFAQQAILQAGPTTPGHAPMYVNSGPFQPVVQDSGPAAGGGLGLGFAEQLLVQRSPTNTYPAADAGTGPDGTNWCDYDAPVTNASGYHYLCLGPNTSAGGAAIIYGAGGAATPLPLYAIVNGATYQFPFSASGGVQGPATTVVGHIATWNNTVGTLLADGGAPLLGPGSSVSNDVACWNNTAGTLLSDCGSLSSLMDTVFSNVQGSVLYRGASGWAALPPGTSGDFLSTNGSAANPSWGAGNPGTVTSVALTVGNGLTTSGTCTISSSGTCNISLTAITPGGRLTTLQSTPIQGTVNDATALYFAPYPAGGSPFVPIYNGTAVQLYPFTSSVTDTVGLTLSLGSNWTANTVYDVFVGLSGGSPALCTVAWSSGTARATSLALYGSMQTNASSATCRTSNSATITCATNQCTYLGTVLTDASDAGQITFSTGGSASGGTAGRLSIWNYYNQVEMVANAIDTGARYGYSSSTIRQCRASAAMQIVYVLGLSTSSLRARLFDNLATAATAGANAGIGFGLDGITSFGVTPATSIEAPTANTISEDQVADISYGPGIFTLGSHYIACLQIADGTTTTEFDNVNSNQLFVAIMM